MLNLSTLHKLLSQVLEPPHLHTAVLLTPEGQLVSYATGPARSKDSVRVVVGLSAEVWQEAGEQGIAFIDSELGRILILPVEETAANGIVEASPESGASERSHDKPLMLVALNSTDVIEWDDLEAKARELTGHLSRPVSGLRGPLTAAPVTPPNPTTARLAR